MIEFGSATDCSWSFPSSRAGRRARHVGAFDFENRFQ